MSSRATTINQEFYDDFWRSCPDFSRYNPGVLHRRRAILHHLRAVPHRKILDVGCGTGELLVWLRARLGEGVTYEGADLSPKVVEANNQRHPFATFHTLDVQREALGATFDAVICTEVVEHLDDRPRALANLAAMVSTGGHIVITCPTGKVHATEKHFGHVDHPTPGELGAQLAAAGFDVVSMRSWGFPLYTALKFATNVRPAWALQNFATTRYSTSAKVVSKALYYANFLNLPTSPLGCQLFVLAQRRS